MKTDEKNKIGRRYVSRDFYLDRKILNEGYRNLTEFEGGNREINMNVIWIFISSVRIVKIIKNRYTSSIFIIYMCKDIFTYVQNKKILHQQWKKKNSKTNWKVLVRNRYFIHILCIFFFSRLSTIRRARERTVSTNRSIFLPLISWSYTYFITVSKMNVLFVFTVTRFLKAHVYACMCLYMNIWIFLCANVCIFISVEKKKILHPAGSRGRYVLEGVVFSVEKIVFSRILSRFNECCPGPWIGATTRACAIHAPSPPPVHPCRAFICKSIAGKNRGTINFVVMLVDICTLRCSIRMKMYSIIRERRGTYFENSSNREYWYEKGREIIKKTIISSILQFIPTFKPTSQSFGILDLGWNNDLSTFRIVQSIRAIVLSKLSLLWKVVFRNYESIGRSFSVFITRWKPVWKREKVICR